MDVFQSPFSPNARMSEAAIKQTVQSTEAAIKNSASAPPPSEPSEYDRVKKIDLKNPIYAGFLSWLIPGWGHLYQGRTAKAILFFFCVVPTFLIGCYLGSSPKAGVARNVYYSWRFQNKRLEFIPQACLGMAAIPAGLQALRLNSGNSPLLGSFMAPPQLDPMDPTGVPPTQTEIVSELNFYYDFGTILTMIAGLMNLLVIFDAADGPIVYRKEDEETEE